MESIDRVGSSYDQYQTNTEWYEYIDHIDYIDQVDQIEPGADLPIPFLAFEPGFLPAQTATTAETIRLAEDTRKMFLANDRYWSERLFSQFQGTKVMDSVAGHRASSDELFLSKKCRVDASPGSPTINLNSASVTGFVNDNSGNPIAASSDESFPRKELRLDGSPGSLTINFKSFRGTIVDARQNVSTLIISNNIWPDMLRRNPAGEVILQEQWLWDANISRFRQVVFLV